MELAQHTKSVPHTNQRKFTNIEDVEISSTNIQ